MFPSDFFQIPGSANRLPSKRSEPYSIGLFYRFIRAFVENNGGGNIELLLVTKHSTLLTETLLRCRKVLFLLPISCWALTEFIPVCVRVCVRFLSVLDHWEITEPASESRQNWDVCCSSLHNGLSPSCLIFTTDESFIWCTAATKGVW